MTEDELKKLADIAGIEIQYTQFENWFWYKENYTHTLWTPHFRIEQAMLVAEGLKKIGFCFVLRNSFYEESPKCYIELHHTNRGKIGSWLGDTPALAICRAALAAKEG